MALHTPVALGRKDNVQPIHGTLDTNTFKLSRVYLLVYILCLPLAFTAGSRQLLARPSGP